MVARSCCSAQRLTVTAKKMTSSLGAFIILSQKWAPAPTLQGRCQQPLRAPVYGHAWVSAPSDAEPPSPKLANILGKRLM